MRGCARADGLSSCSPPPPFRNISTPVHRSLPRHAAQQPPARAATHGQEHLQPSPTRAQLIIHHEDGPSGRITRNPLQISGTYTPLPVSRRASKARRPPDQEGRHPRTTLSGAPAAQPSSPIIRKAGTAGESALRALQSGPPRHPGLLVDIKEWQGVQTAFIDSILRLGRGGPGWYS